MRQPLGDYLGRWLRGLGFVICWLAIVELLVREAWRLAKLPGRKVLLVIHCHRSLLISLQLSTIVARSLPDQPIRLARPQLAPRQRLAIFFDLR